jgi:hypothetical protein
VKVEEILGADAARKAIKDAMVCTRVTLHCIAAAFFLHWRLCPARSVIGCARSYSVELFEHTRVLCICAFRGGQIGTRFLVKRAAATISIDGMTLLVCSLLVAITVQQAALHTCRTARAY